MSSSADETLRQKAYAIIQYKLLNGEIRVGDLVSEQTLAEEFGMSRTPVREAIGQLEIEGLFDKVPRVGTIVRLPGERELRELYEVREALESQAAFKAASLLTRPNLAEMERWQTQLLSVVAEMEAQGLEVANEPLLHRFFEADIAFHARIVEAAQNRRTSQIVSEFRVVQRVFEYNRMTYTLNFIRGVTQEHGEVLQSLQRADADAARGAMAAHIRSSCEHAMRSAAHHETSPSSHNANSETEDIAPRRPKFERWARRKSAADTTSAKQNVTA